MANVLTGPIKGFLKKVQIYNFNKYSNIISADLVKMYIRLIYKDKFITIRVAGRDKQVYAKDCEHISNIMYMQYIFNRKVEHIIPENIANMKEIDDIDEEFDIFNEGVKRDEFKSTYSIN